MPMDGPGKNNFPDNLNSLPASGEASSSQSSDASDKRVVDGQTVTPRGNLEQHPQPSDKPVKERTVSASETTSAIAMLTDLATTQRYCHQLQTQLSQVYSGVLLMHSPLWGYQGLLDFPGSLYQCPSGTMVNIAPGGVNLSPALRGQFCDYYHHLFQHQTPINQVLYQQLAMLQLQLQPSLGQLATWAINEQLLPQQFIYLLPPLEQPHPVALSAFSGLPAQMPQQAHPVLPSGCSIHAGYTFIKGFPPYSSHWVSGSVGGNDLPEEPGFYFRPQPQSVSHGVFRNPLDPGACWCERIKSGLHLPKEEFYHYMSEAPEAWVYRGVDIDDSRHHQWSDIEKEKLAGSDKQKMPVDRIVSNPRNSERVTTDTEPKPVKHSVSAEAFNWLKEEKEPLTLDVVQNEEKVKPDTKASNKPLPSVPVDQRTSGTKNESRAIESRRMVDNKEKAKKKKVPPVQPSGDSGPLSNLRKERPLDQDKIERQLHNELNNKLKGIRDGRQLLRRTLPPETENGDGPDFIDPARKTGRGIKNTEARPGPKAVKDSCQHVSIQKGFHNFTNTCFANSALKAMLAAYPPSVFEPLRRWPLASNDPEREVRNAFLGLLDTVYGHKDGTANCQLELERLFQACHAYGAANNSQVFRTIFSSPVAGNMLQQDAQEFFTELCSVLGIFENNPDLSITHCDVINYDVSGINPNAKLTRVTPDNSLTKTISLPVPNGGRGTIEESLNRHLGGDGKAIDVNCDMRDSPHRLRLEDLSQDDLVNAIGEGALLQARRSFLLQADVKKVQTLAIQLVLFKDNAGRPGINNEKPREQAKSLFANSGESLSVIIEDKSTQKKYRVKFRQKSICLHQGASIASGHYTTAIKEGNHWVHHNDNIVGEIATSPMNFDAGEPYLIFYERDPGFEPVLVS